MGVEDVMIDGLRQDDLTNRAAYGRKMGVEDVMIDGLRQDDVTNRAA